MPSIETLLEGQDLATYHSLRDDTRTNLSDEFVPHLISQGLDLEDVKSFLTLVVRAEKEAFDAHHATYDLAISSDQWGSLPAIPDLCFLNSPAAG